MASLPDLSTSATKAFKVAYVDGENARVCKQCNTLKPFTEFYPNKQCKYGYTSRCKECERPRLLKWKKDNLEHRKKQARDYHRERKLKAIEYMGNKCHDCGVTYPPYIYQFHHLDPNTKDLNPSAAKNWERLKLELDKCVMLCANCHMERHYGNSTGE